MVMIFNKRFNDASQDAFYVGRPTQYGNLFTHLKGKTLAQFVVGSVEESVEAYRKWLDQTFLPFQPTDAFTLQFFTPIIGKDLVCWCTPKGGIEHTTRPFVCHAQWLACYAEAFSLLITKVV